MPVRNTPTKSDVGLGNCDNTSDVNKPVSTAQAAADALKVAKAGDSLTGALAVTRGLTTDNAYTAAVTGDTQYRLYTQANGVMGWGSGSATQDTNLYRSGVGVLATDNTFNAVSGLQIAGVGSGLWTTYTPTLSTGWALGNGTNSSRYCQIGKTVFFSVALVWGSTSTFGSGLDVGLPVTAASNPQRFHGIAHGNKVGVNDYILAWYGHTTTAVSVVIIGTNGAAGNVTSTVPFAPVSGDGMFLSGQYEAA